MKNQREKSGIVFKNDRKKEETHPDFNGQFCLNGIQYRASFWKKNSESGTSFLSMSITEITYGDANQNQDDFNI